MAEGKIINRHNVRGPQGKFRKKELGDSRKQKTLRASVMDLINKVATPEQLEEKFRDIKDPEKYLRMSFELYKFIMPQLKSINATDYFAEIQAEYIKEAKVVETQEAIEEEKINSRL